MLSMGESGIIFNGKAWHSLTCFVGGRDTSEAKDEHRW